MMFGTDKNQLFINCATFQGIWKVSIGECLQ